MFIVILAEKKENQTRYTAEHKNNNKKRINSVTHSIKCDILHPRKK